VIRHHVFEDPFDGGFTILDVVTGKHVATLDTMDEVRAWMEGDRDEPGGGDPQSHSEGFGD